MALKAKADAYANVAVLNVTETAAGTLTAAKFAFPFSIMDKMALIIQRIEYSFTGIEQLNSNGDKIYAALTASNTISNLYNQADPLLIDNCHLDRYDFGAAASGFMWQSPYVKDFTNLAGGGIIVAPAPLYAAVQSSGAAAATGIWLKLVYTYIELSADEYWQLVESRRVISG